MTPSLPKPEPQLAARRPARRQRVRKQFQHWQPQGNSNSACSSELPRLCKTSPQFFSNTAFQGGCFPIKKMYRFQQHIAGGSLAMGPGKVTFKPAKKGASNDSAKSTILRMQGCKWTKLHQHWLSQGNCNRQSSPEPPRIDETRLGLNCKNFLGRVRGRPFKGSRFAAKQTRRFFFSSR